MLLHEDGQAALKELVAVMAVAPGQVCDWRRVEDLAWCIGQCAKASQALARLSDQVVNLRGGEIIHSRLVKQQFQSLNVGPGFALINTRYNRG